jgi:hypothetical protein
MRTLWFILLLTLFGCGKKPIDGPETEQEVTGTYLKVYGMRFAATVTDNGFRRGAFAVGADRDEQTKRKVYKLRFEMYTPEGVLVRLKVNALGVNGALVIRDWTAEAKTGEHPLTEEIITQWHKKAHEKTTAQLR